MRVSAATQTVTIDKCDGTAPDVYTFEFLANVAGTGDMVIEGVQVLEQPGKANYGPPPIYETQDSSLTVTGVDYGAGIVTMGMGVPKKCTPDYAIFHSGKGQIHSVSDLLKFNDITVKYQSFAEPFVTAPLSTLPDGSAKGLWPTEPWYIPAAKTSSLDYEKQLAQVAKDISEAEHKYLKTQKETRVPSRFELIGE
jgi:hypothetical protein